MIERKLAPAVQSLTQIFQVGLDGMKGFLSVGDDQTVIDQKKNLTSGKPKLTLEGWLLFDPLAVLQRCLKDPTEFFLIGTLEELFPIIEKSSPAARLINADICLVSDQQDSGAVMEVTVISDIVIFPVRGLNPRVKNMDKSLQWHPVGGRNKEFYIELL